MLPNAPLPLLFADADAVVTIIAVVIGIITWIIRVISNAGNPVPPVPAKGRPPVRQRDDRLSQEISIFLEESAKNSPARGNENKTQKRPAKPAKKTPPPPEPKAKKPPRRLVPGQEVAARHLDAQRDLGDNVRKNVQQHLSDNIGKEVSQHLKSRISESVSEHLGTSSTAPPPSLTSGMPSKAQGLAEALRNPATIRQAIVMNMILSRPRSLERK